MKNTKKIFALMMVGAFLLSGSVASATESVPGPVCMPHSLSVVSDTNTKVVDIDGTAQNYNSVLVSNVAAIQALGANVWTADVGSTDAKWVWSEDPYDTDWQVDKFVTFERSFTVVGTPTSSVLMIASDNSYEVWVNGNPVGSSMDENNHSTADTIVVPVSALNTGPNTLTIKVKNWALPNNPQENNPGGLLFNLVVDSEHCSEPCATPDCCAGDITVKNTNNATVINTVTTIVDTGLNSSNGGSAKAKARGRGADAIANGGNAGSSNSGNASSNSTVVNKVNKNVVRVRR